jgi:hypothetical protein
LDIGGNKFTEVKNIPKTVKYINCDHNSIKTLECSNLENLVELNCSSNRIAELNLYNLSSKFKILDYSRQYGIATLEYLNVTLINGIPDSIEILYCTNVDMVTLPKLPSNLKFLDCGKNNIKRLPKLPESLLCLDVTENENIKLGKMPKNLHCLRCEKCNLSKLNIKNSNLTTLMCNNNKLTNLELPNGLYSLQCSSNLLRELTLPETVIEVICNRNYITKIEKLPDCLVYLEVVGNNIKTFPNIPVNIYEIVKYYTEESSDVGEYYNYSISFDTISY